jgi:hypothetical protein
MQISCCHRENHKCYLRSDEMGSQSDRRRAELDQLRQSDPAQIIAIFKGISGISPDGQLPYGVSFDAMISAIVAFEEQQQTG